MRLLLLLLAAAVALGNRVKRQGDPNATKWPNNTMNYYYADNLPFEIKAMFRDAFWYISTHTCINFKYDASATYTTRLIFDDQNGECYSYYGMTLNNQDLKFAFDCGVFGVAVHETMHRLGIVHEQSRSDRNDYLIVNSASSNDVLMPNTYNPVPFDYGSIMLYQREDSRLPKDANFNYTMGNQRVAFYDMLLLNDFYNCSCNGQPQLTCQNGGYQNPADCTSCLCTDGFTGTLCDQLDGQVFTATTEWYWQSFWVNKKAGSNSNTIPQERYFHITAPPGNTIEVQLLQIDGFFCQNTCDYNGIEIKYNTDRRMTSPLICCNNDNLWNTTRRSTQSPMVIVKYGEEKGPFLKFQYRYVPGNVTNV